MTATIQTELAKNTFEYWAAASVVSRKTDESPRAKRLLFRLAHGGSTEALRLAAAKALMRTVQPQRRL